MRGDYYIGNMESAEQRINQLKQQFMKFKEQKNNLDTMSPDELGLPRREEPNENRNIQNKI